MFIGWDGDSDVRTEGVNHSAKIVDKKVRKSLEDAFKTAKTLHKHFKVCMYCMYVCMCMCMYVLEFVYNSPLHP